MYVLNVCNVCMHSCMYARMFRESVVSSLWVWIVTRSQYCGLRPHGYFAQNPQLVGWSWDPQSWSKSESRPNATAGVSIHLYIWSRKILTNCLLTSVAMDWFGKELRETLALHVLPGLPVGFPWSPNLVSVTFWCPPWRFHWLPASASSGAWPRCRLKIDKPLKTTDSIMFVRNNWAKSIKSTIFRES